MAQRWLGVLIQKPTPTQTSFLPAATALRETASGARPDLTTSAGKGADAMTKGLTAKGREKGGGRDPGAEGTDSRLKTERAGWVGWKC